MRFESLLPLAVLVAVGVISSPAPQATESLPFEIANGSNNNADGTPQSFQGEIVGTGADGTTYVISVTSSATDGFPGTATVVADASHASAFISQSIDGGFIQENIGCAISGSNAVCTEEIVNIVGSVTTSFTATTTDTDGLVAVAVSTAAGFTSSASVSIPTGGTVTSSGSSPTSSSSAGRSAVVSKLVNALPLVFAAAML